MDVARVPPNCAGAFTSRRTRSGSGRVYRGRRADAQFEEGGSDRELRNGERLYREGRDRAGNAGSGRGAEAEGSTANRSRTRASIAGVIEMNGPRVVRILSFMLTHPTRPGLTRCPSSVLRHDADCRGCEGAQWGKETEDGQEKTHEKMVSRSQDAAHGGGHRNIITSPTASIQLRGSAVQAHLMDLHVMKP